MNILIDSDVVSAFTGSDEVKYQTIQTYFSRFKEPPTIFLSMLTIYEMEYSLAAFIEEKQEEKRQVQKNFELFKETLPNLNLSFESARIYGQLKHQFRQKTGIPKKALKRHNIDIALASIAIAHDCLLVSQDGIYADHLQPLDARLKYQNWNT
jgi:predicted nucleic acid-binding protein